MYWIKIKETDIGPAGSFFKGETRQVENLEDLPESLQYEEMGDPLESQVDQKQRIRQQNKAEFERLQAAINNKREKVRTLAIEQKKVDAEAQDAHRHYQSLAAEAAEIREKVEADQQIVADPKTHGNAKTAAKKRIESAGPIFREARIAELAARIMLAQSETVSAKLEMTKLEIENAIDEQKPLAAAAGIQMPGDEPQQPGEPQSGEPTESPVTGPEDAANAQGQDAAPNTKD